MTDSATQDGTRSEVLSTRARKTILWANIAMIAMIVIHDSDHVRQAANWCYTISAQLWLVNVSVYVPSLIALALLWRGKGAGRKQHKYIFLRTLWVV